MKDVFNETQLKKHIFKNRIFRSATWEGMADENGYVTDYLAQVYRDLANGEIGAIFTGMTTISPVDKTLPGLMKFFDNSYINSNKKLVDVSHIYNCPIIIQTAIIEYQKIDSHNNIRSISINDINYNDILCILELFQNAAIRAQESGYDGIQISCH